MIALWVDKTCQFSSYKAASLCHKCIHLTVKSAIKLSMTTLPLRDEPKFPGSINLSLHFSVLPAGWHTLLCNLCCPSPRRRWREQGEGEGTRWYKGKVTRAKKQRGSYLCGGENSCYKGVSNWREEEKIKQLMRWIWRTRRGGYLDIHHHSESLRSAWSTELPSGGAISHDCWHWKKKKLSGRDFYIFQPVG